MNLEVNEQQASYIMQILATRPLGEALDLFSSLQRQLAMQTGQARPTPVEQQPQPLAS